jgi:hypothetical protein
MITNHEVNRHLMLQLNSEADCYTTSILHEGKSSPRVMLPAIL